MKGLNSDIIRSLEVPLPALSEQHRIVEILEQADRLRHLRAAADTKAERILGALFAKMFANPASTCEVHRLSKLLRDKPGSLQSGPFGTHLHNSDFVREGTVLAVGIDNVLDGRFIIGRNRRITDEKYAQLEKYTLEPGDVLVTIMGTVGRSCVYPGAPTPAICTKHVYRIQVSERVHPEYLSAAIRFSPTLRSQLGSSTSGQIVAGTTSTDIRNLNILLPPRDVQDEYAKYKMAVDSNRTLAQSARRRIDELFEHLLMRAFSGNLTASWRKAHERELLDEMDLQARALVVVSDD